MRKFVEASVKSLLYFPLLVPWKACEDIFWSAWKLHRPCSSDIGAHFLSWDNNTRFIVSIECEIHIWNPLLESFDHANRCFPLPVIPINGINNLIISYRYPDQG